MKNIYLCTHTRVIQQSKKQYNTKRLNVTGLAMAKMITVRMLWNIKLRQNILTSHKTANNRKLEIMYLLIINIIFK